MSVFMHHMHSYIHHYESTEDNVFWYHHPAGYKVECEKRMFDTPGNCTAIDNHGTIVATKTEMQNWQNVTIWPNLILNHDQSK